MKNKHTLQVFFVLFVAPFSFYSQNQLKELFRMADTTNASLRSIRIEKYINKEEKKSYLSARFPQLNFNADYKYNAIIPGQVVPAAFFGGAPGTYATVQFGVPYVLSNNLQLSQILFNSQLNYGLAALKINQEIIDIKENMTAQEVRYEIASKYIQYQGLLMQKDFLDSNITNTTKLKENIRALVTQELKIPSDEKEIQLVISELNLFHQTIESNISSLKDFIFLLCGIPLDSQYQLTENKDIKDSYLDLNSNENMYSLEMLNTQIKMTNEKIKGLKMAYLPSLNAYGIYNYSLNMKPDDNFRKGIDGAFIGLRADWNLFDGLQKQNQLKMARFEEDQLQIEIDNAQKQLELGKLDAKKQIKLAENKIALTQEKIELNQEIYENNLLKYNQGLLGSSDLLLSLNKLISSRNDLALAFTELRTKELNYLKLIGNIN